MLSTDLILKGLGGVAVVGGASGVGIWYFSREKVETLTLSDLTEKVGLNCTPAEGQKEETGINCTKKNGSPNIKVKKGTTDIEVSAISGGKIKVYKTSAGEDHNNGFKFVIEENDISGTDANNKLEEFETYEIKQDGADWKLIRKDDATVKLKKELGLDDCKFPTGDEGCTLDEAKFKKIKFEGGDDKATVTGNPKLKITKVTGEEYGKYKFKFVLESQNEAKISGAVTIAANTNTEFKIKKAEGTNKLTLEKAWTVTTLGAKVGLTCTAANGNPPKQCSLGTKINVKDGANSRKDATFENGDTNKKLTFEEDAQGHNQGFKFTTTEAITLQNGTPNSGAPTSIEKTNTTYQILKDGDAWYLTKKAAG